MKHENQENSSSELVRGTADESSRASERRFRSTFENVAVGIAQVNFAGSFIRVNQRFCDITGYSKDELREKHFSDITHPDDKDADSANAEQLKSGQIQSYQMEKRYLRKDGNEVWVLLTGSLQRDDTGKPECFIGVVEDISRWKKAEIQLREWTETLEQRVRDRTIEVEQKNQQLRALAAQLGHSENRERKRLARVLHDNIQQMLVAAQLQIESAKRNPQDMDSFLDRASSILMEAVDASRDLTVQLSPPILHEAGLLPALHWLAQQMKDKNQLTVEIFEETDIEPIAEELRFLLFECTRELLRNVWKHSDAAEARVQVALTDDGKFQIAVADRGRGFDADEVRQRTATDSSFGLFNIEERLLHVGGTISIDSAPDEGTRVVMTVPLADTLEPGIEERQLMSTVQADLLGVRAQMELITVVIADDHQIMREGLAGIMEFDPDLELVGEAASGREALALVEQLKPDIVILDINLGDINGVEVTRKISANWPDTKVIGLSMYSEDNVASAMQEAGAVAYLTKGGPSDKLFAAIHEAAGGQSSE